MTYNVFSGTLNLAQSITNKINSSVRNNKKRPEASCIRPLPSGVYRPHVKYITYEQKTQRNHNS